MAASSALLQHKFSLYRLLPIMRAVGVGLRNRKMWQVRSFLFFILDVESAEL